MIILKTILIIEDDKDINEMLQKVLKTSGYNIKSAYSGTKALLLHDKSIDLIILDLMLPGKSEEEIIKELKNIKEVPIIVTSAITDINKKLDLFELGADDYVTKPFNNYELLARIKVHLKHNFNNQNCVLKINDIELNPKSYKIVCNGIDISLSKIEFEILKLLMKNNNQVVTKSVLFDTVWDTMDSTKDTTVEDSIDEIISLLNTSEKVLNLLSDNQDAWNVEGNNIVFSNDNVRNQYDELINSIG